MVSGDVKPNVSFFYVMLSPVYTTVSEDDKHQDSNVKLDHQLGASELVWPIGKALG